MSQSQNKSSNLQAQTIIDFWVEAGPQKWFSKSDAFDASIKENFGALLISAAKGELDAWMDEPDPCLALIILLDQFSRNLNRNSAKAFENDVKALQISKNAIKNGFFDKIDPSLALFMILPLMHSEDLEDQEQCLALIKSKNMDMAVKSAKEHLDIIKQFGRFPHRNSVLGRETTQQEQQFLDDGGFKG